MMTGLLFLGQVPFTNIFISFWVWLGLVIGGSLAGYYLYRRRREVTTWLLAAYVVWLIHHYQFAQISNVTRLSP
ncbi:MAG: LPXTG cell wall anchor domain-containing protein [Candidatus Saccharimonadales bacterium]